MVFYINVTFIHIFIFIYFMVRRLHLMMQIYYVINRIEGENFVLFKMIK